MLLICCSGCVLDVLKEIGEKKSSIIAFFFFFGWLYEEFSGGHEHLFGKM